MLEGRRGPWGAALSPRSRCHHEQGVHTHSAQPGLGPGPSCQVSAGTGILVSRKPSPGGGGARGLPSRTSSGFLCTVSTEGRRGENRGQEQTLAWTVQTRSNTRHAGSPRTRTGQDTGTHAGAGGTGLFSARAQKGLPAALALPPCPGRPPILRPHVWTGHRGAQHGAPWALSSASVGTGEVVRSPGVARGLSPSSVEQPSPSG